MRRHEIPSDLEVLAILKARFPSRGSLSLSAAARMTGINRRSIGLIRARLREMGLWPWSNEIPGAPDGGKECSQVTPEFQREVEVRRVEVLLASTGHLARDDRDNDHHDAIGCVGFGHSPPIPGGPVCRWFRGSGSGSGEWRDINDPLLLLSCREACRLMIAQARQKGWIGQRTRNVQAQQVA